jgi:hypothetical protein
MVRMVVHSMLSGSRGLPAEGTSGYKPVKGTMMTRWATHINPENVLPEYPRPLMVRSDWCNLNGLWDYAFVDKNRPQPGRFEG